MRISCAAGPSEATTRSAQHTRTAAKLKITDKKAQLVQRYILISGTTNQNIIHNTVSKQNGEGKTGQDGTRRTELNNVVETTQSTFDRHQLKFRCKEKTSFDVHAVNIPPKALSAAMSCWPLLKFYRLHTTRNIGEHMHARSLHVCLHSQKCFFFFFSWKKDLLD